MSAVRELGRPGWTWLRLTAQPVTPGSLRTDQVTGRTPNIPAGDTSLGQAAPRAHPWTWRRPEPRHILLRRSRSSTTASGTLIGAATPGQAARRGPHHSGHRFLPEVPRRATAHAVAGHGAESLPRHRRPLPWRSSPPTAPCHRRRSTRAGARKRLGALRQAAPPSDPEPGTWEPPMTPERGVPPRPIPRPGAAMPRRERATTRPSPGGVGERPAAAGERKVRRQVPAGHTGASPDTRRPGRSPACDNVYVLRLRRQA